MPSSPQQQTPSWPLSPMSTLFSSCHQRIGPQAQLWASIIIFKTLLICEIKPMTLKPWNKAQVPADHSNSPWTSTLTSADSGWLLEVTPISVYLLIPLLLLRIMRWSESMTCFVVSDSMTLWTVAIRLLCPWDYSCKNTRVDCHFPQGILLTRGSTKPLFPAAPTLANGLFTTEPPGKPPPISVCLLISLLLPWIKDKMCPHVLQKNHSILILHQLSYEGSPFNFNTNKKRVYFNTSSWEGQDINAN